MEDEDQSVLGGMLGTARRMGWDEQADELERRIAAQKIARLAKKTLNGIVLNDEQIGRIVAILGGGR